MKRQITSDRLLKACAEKMISRGANSTTCIFAYQPKTPAALKQFSKVENDK